MAAEPLDQTGRWIEPQFDIPVFAINSIVLPTGKVLWFAYPYNPDLGDRTQSDYANAWLWDPSKGTRSDSFEKIDPPIDPRTHKPANIWCAGNSLLASGEVLVTGGNLKYVTPSNKYEGLNHVYTFDPFTEKWTQQPDMNHGRWYPSQMLMPDGRTFIMGGLDETGAGHMNEDLELFTPGARRGDRGTVTFLGPEGVLNNPGQPPAGDYYPHMFWMPSGRGLIAGPFTIDSWWLNPPGSNTAAVSWTDVPNSARSRVWGTAVMVPGGTDGSHEVVQLGGSDRPANDLIAVKSATLFDEREASPAWHTKNPGDQFALNVPRSHANTVLLPDGTMVEVGGGWGSKAVVDSGDNGAPGQWAAESAQLNVELWDPKTRMWRLGPAQREYRTYHSTAVLLPDGRVVSAGDDYNGAYPVGDKANFTHDTAEIYEPPYLFDGDSPAARPAIKSAPQVILPGQSFDIGTDPSKPAATEAVLMGPGAATHAVDMSQRYVPLEVTDSGPGRLSVKAPPSYNVALPGYYMLFVLDAAGTPSVAAWLHVGPAPLPALPPQQPPSQPPTQPQPPAQPPIGGSGPAKVVKAKVRSARIIRRSGKRYMRITLSKATKTKVRVRIVWRDRRKHTVRRLTVTLRTGRTTTLKTRVPSRVRTLRASVLS
jgi:hypothetical protein